jgi:hypothetical protein
VLVAVEGALEGMGRVGAEDAVPLLQEVEGDFLRGAKVFSVPPDDSDKHCFFSGSLKRLPI